MSCFERVEGYCCHFNPGKAPFNDLLSTALEVDVSWIVRACVSLSPSSLPLSPQHLPPFSVPLSPRQAHVRVFGLLLQAHARVFGLLLQARVRVSALLLQILF